MTCSVDLIAAYLDEELDAAQRAAVERHVTDCPGCSEACARLRKQKAGIQAAASYYTAPPELQRLVRHGLRRLDAETSTPASSSPWRWVAVAASLLLAASVSWNVVQLHSGAQERDMAEIVLNDHLSSLLGSHLLDVVSSDQHTVKPWFAGKLDFSPDVKDLAAQGFPLAGGRVDYLAGRRVAALVYHRRQHVINLFIWPGGSSAPSPTGITHNGYNLLHWTAGRMTFWAVSDVSSAELQDFRNRLR